MRERNVTMYVEAISSADGGTRSIIAACHQVKIAVMAQYFINQNPVMESVLSIARTQKLITRDVLDTLTSVAMIMVLICAGTSAQGTPPAFVAVPK